MHYECKGAVLLEILSVSFPIYLLIFIGYLCTRTGLFKKEDMRVLGKFVINLALPALIFDSLSRQSVNEVFNLTYFLTYLSGSFIVIGIGFLWLQSNRVNSAIYALGMGCSNSGFVGYPILILALPSVAGRAFPLNLIVENCFVIPFLLMMAETHVNQADHWKDQLRQSLAGLCKNPLIIALLAGAMVSIAGIHLPQPVSHTISMLALASGAISLFVIGGTLVNLPMQGMVMRSLPIVFAKLIIHPLAVALASLLLPILFNLPPLTPAMRNAAVLFAAMPMMGVFPIFAQKYGKENLASATLLITTVCSIFTLNVFLWLML